jgi:hypothetical protein
MSTFTKAAASAARTPQRHVTLDPSAFADGWAEKPLEEVAIGLRLVGEDDVQAARVEAARLAIGWYDDGEGGCVDEDARVEAYNDALVRWIVARGATDPNDVTQPYFAMAEETVRVALTSEGVRRIWDELVLLQIGAGVRMAPATDPDLARLARALPFVGKLAEGPQAEVRKLLAHCLEQLAPFAGEPEEDDGGEDVAVYEARRGA